MPAYLSSGFCRRLGKNKRIQRWLDRHWPSTGPCGAHGASDDDLEVPHRASSEVSRCTSCNKMPHPLFCLLDRGEKPGHVYPVWCRTLRKNKNKNAAVATPALAEHRPMWSSRCLKLTTGEYLCGPLEYVILLYGLSSGCHQVSD